MSNPWFYEECREMLRARWALDRISPQRRGGPRAETLMSFRRTQAQVRRLFTRKKESRGQNMSQSLTPTPQSSMCGTGWGRYLAKFTPPPPTTVQDSRQSRNRMRRSESTSLLTIPKSTTNPSGWGISGVPSWRPSPVPLDLMGSTTIYWNISLVTHWKTSKISWITSGPQETSRTSGEQPLWSPSPNQTRTMLTPIVTDQSRWPAACARS